MAEYGSAVEGALLAEEEVIECAEAAEREGTSGHFHAYLSFYIAGISMIVAVAALMTALAADQSMDDSLENLAKIVERNGLRVELRYHELQKDLANISGRDATAEVQPVIAQVSQQLSTVEHATMSLESDARRTLKAHYILAVGITLLQVATALAATVGITTTRHLLVPSGMFACGGVCLTLVGVVDYLA
jgi:hypothetical protein